MPVRTKSCNEFEFFPRKINVDIEFHHKFDEHLTTRVHLSWTTVSRNKSCLNCQACCSNFYRNCDLEFLSKPHNNVTVKSNFFIASAEINPMTQNFLSFISLSNSNSFQHFSSHYSSIRIFSVFNCREL